MFTLWSRNAAGLRPAPATTMWVRGEDRVLVPAARSSSPRTGLWKRRPGAENTAQRGRCGLPAARGSLPQPAGSTGGWCLQRRAGGDGTDVSAQMWPSWGQLVH